MRAARVLAQILIIVLAALLCSAVVFASGETLEGSASITFLEPDPAPPVNPGNPAGPGGSGGGTDQIDTDRIPAGNVTILDPQTPTTVLGQLPKTGGDFGITCLFLAIGAGFLFAALGKGDRQKAGEIPA